MKKLKVGNKVGNFFTVGEVCNELGISIIYLRKLEERKIIPEANYRYRKPNWEKAGNRIYSVQLVAKLIPIITRFKQGIKIDSESIRKISLAFQEEREYFNN